MPLLDRLRKCHAELQKAVKQPMQGPEEDELLTEIANISNMATLLKERVAAKQAGRARQAFDLLKPWMDDLNDVASIRSNLTHIFHNQHKAPTVQIVEDLTSEDPNLLMDFACTVRTGKWTDKHMTFELYKCVKAWLKDSLRPPWDEKVSKALNEALNELMETTLKDSETFKAFFARAASFPKKGRPATRCKAGRLARRKATSNVCTARQTGTCTSTTRYRATGNIATIFKVAFAAWTSTYISTTSNFAFTTRRKATPRWMANTNSDGAFTNRCMAPGNIAFATRRTHTRTSTRCEATSNATFATRRTFVKYHPRKYSTTY
ncbi:uncharacterized protein K444DRAFT_103516 [Hyaloscypha bicolor E]|uniref:Uncharacterized protein n=1 Tax=Hyaloscypha bicolor E TaxID=1095630 RepID=A0A2J6SX37_9HELO|nr:uncharacterized protein K444DRAFT_103516 [Hyaloscypha bicolor E]PMD55338.1 hypothetical protein K444DRAFT_103516 [Hyaloscypha bicolor E]